MLTAHCLRETALQRVAVGALGGGLRRGLGRAVQGRDLRREEGNEAAPGGLPKREVFGGAASV